MDDLNAPYSAGVWLQTLGGFRALTDAGEIDIFATRRQRAAVLLYLAIEGEATRDRLLALFWPDQDRERSRRALNQTLYLLRQVLGQDSIESVGDRLRASTRIETDAARFVRALGAGARDEALTLYTGAFLGGTELARTQEFLAWVDVQRARLDRLHRTARREQIADLARAGRLEDALASARAWVSLDPSDDEAEHRLIQLLAEVGLRTEALRQYQAYERLLAGENVEPLDETRELVAQLRAGEVAPLPRLPPPPEQDEPPPAVATSQTIETHAPRETTASADDSAAEDVPDTADAGIHVADSGASRDDAPVEADVLERRADARPSARLAGFVALAGVVLFALVALLVARDTASGEPDPRQVAVLPFRFDGDSALIYLSAGVADLMAIRLQERGGLRTTPQAEVMRAWQREAGAAVADTTAARMAAELGAGIVVTGEISGMRERLRVRARLRESTGTAPPIEREATGSLGDLPLLIDRLADELVRAAAARRPAN